MSVLLRHLGVMESSVCNCIAKKTRCVFNLLLVTEK